MLDKLGIEISPARLKCAMLSLDTLQLRVGRPCRLARHARRPDQGLPMARGPVREVTAAEAAELIDRALS